MKLGKFKEANKLFKKVIKHFRESNERANNDSEDFSSYAKLKLKQFTDTSTLDNTMNVTKGKISPLVFAYAAFTKYKLEKFEAAEILYNQALKACGNKPIPSPLIFGIASAKFKLGKLEEADNLYDQIIKIFEGNVPAFVLHNHNAALVKQELEMI